MKILVVENDKKVARFIKRGLEEEGYEAEAVHDGDEGLRRLAEGSYGLVILETDLPKMSGLTLVRELRAKKNLTPAIMLTVRDSVEDIVAGLDAGADDYLKKPFDFAELMARIRALQRRSEHERGARIYFSDLCLDPVTHQVWRGERLIELTAKEYELLEYLARHPNQVMTRNMIADVIWEGAFDKFTNIIDVYINYLRRKIDKGAERKLIRTVRGVGYVLREDD